MFLRPASKFSPLVSIVRFITCGLGARKLAGLIASTNPLVAKRRRLRAASSSPSISSTVPSNLSRNREIALPHRVEDRVLAPFGRRRSGGRAPRRRRSPGRASRSTPRAPSTRPRRPRSSMPSGRRSAAAVRSPKPGIALPLARLSAHASIIICCARRHDQRPMLHVLEAGIGGSGVGRRSCRPHTRHCGRSEAIHGQHCKWIASSLRSSQ